MATEIQFVLLLS